MEHSLMRGYLPPPIKILLADDDSDDRRLFQRALKTVPISTKYAEVIDGEKLLNYLQNDVIELPDLLFLDLNMPRKNGLECLLEMQLDERLKLIPVITYSTSLREEVADVLYKNGAYYYIKKTNLADLEFVLNKVLYMISENTFNRPERANFIMSLPGHRTLI
ncbi:MAG: response regulator [Ferruginibacter sp.]